MFAGRKLLVADDSPYYRTVISLTFTDEGMAVTTAGDSQEALAKLEQSAPDVILANVSMTGISGYELCEQIKQSERFGHIPVMLLVGIHEPFDRAEARRVGADDVVTKPFKSIRQLVSRVGSLLGGKTPETEDTDRGYSTLGLDRPDDAQTADPDNQIMDETNVRVFVEAPSMPEYEPDPTLAAAESMCASDIELQTRNTQKLERIDDEPASEIIEPMTYAQDDTMDTMEMKPAITADETFAAPTEVGLDEHISPIGAPEMNEEPNPRAAPLPTQSVFNDALLDLGDLDSLAQRAGAEDLVLDLDYEEPTSASAVPETVPESGSVTEAAARVEGIAPEHAQEEPPVAELQEWAIVTETPAEAPARVTEDQGLGDPKLALSPEAIDAIARRAVEHLSEKVVREIAWEVVPELAELLIKKKLEEQK